MREVFLFICGFLVVFSLLMWFTDTAKKPALTSSQALEITIDELEENYIDEKYKDSTEIKRLY